MNENYYDLKLGMNENKIRRKTKIYGISWTSLEEIRILFSFFPSTWVPPVNTSRWKLKDERKSWQIARKEEVKESHGGVDRECTHETKTWSPSMLNPPYFLHTKVGINSVQTANIKGNEEGRRKGFCKSCSVGWEHELFDCSSEGSNVRVDSTTVYVHR